MGGGQERDKEQNQAAVLSFPASQRALKGTGPLTLLPGEADLGTGKAAHPRVEQGGMGKAEPGSAGGPRHPWVLWERLQGALHAQGRQPPPQRTPDPSHLQPQPLFLLHRYSTSKAMGAEQRERQKAELLRAPSPALAHVFPAGCHRRETLEGITLLAFAEGSVPELLGAEQRFGAAQSRPPQQLWV